MHTYIYIRINWFRKKGREKWVGSRAEEEVTTRVGGKLKGPRLNTCDLMFPESVVVLSHRVWLRTMWILTPIILNSDYVITKDSRPEQRTLLGNKWNILSFASQIFVTTYTQYTHTRTHTHTYTHTFLVLILFSVVSDCRGEWEVF